jgi:hypothetical protein
MEGGNETENGDFGYSFCEILANYPAAQRLKSGNPDSRFAA